MSHAPRRYRRMFVVLAALLLAVLVATAVLLTREWSHRRVAQFAIGKVSGARTHLKHAWIVPKVTLDGLSLSDPDAGVKENPVLRIERLELDYEPRPSAARYVQEVWLFGVALEVDGANPGNTNYDFVTRFLQAPSSGFDPLCIIPQRFNVEGFRAGVLMPDWGARLGPLDISGEVMTFEDLGFHLHAQPLSLSWRVGASDWQDVPDGMLDVEVERGKNIFWGKAQAALPPIARFESTYTVQLDEQGYAFAGEVPSLHLESPLWSEAASQFLPIPVRFVSVDAGNVAVQAHWGGGKFTLSELRLDAAIEGLGIGSETEPWYHGDVRLKGHGGMGDRANVAGAVTFAQEQSLGVFLEGDPGNAEVRMELEKWSRKQVAGLVPAAYQGLFAGLPGLQGLSAKTEIAWRAPRYELSLSATPVLGAGKVQLDVSGAGAPGEPDGPLFDGNLEAAYGDGSMLVEGTVRAVDHMDCTLRLTNVNPGDWLAAWTESAAIGDAAAVLDGVVTVQRRPESPANLGIDVTLPTLAYGALTWPGDIPLSVKTELDMDVKTGSLQGRNTTVTAGEDLRLESTSWRLEPASLQAGAEWGGAVTLPRFSELLGYPDLWGEVAFEGSLTTADGMHVSAGLFLTAESLGYGDWYLPYGTPLKVTAPVEVNRNDGSCAVDGLTATLGEGTKLTVEQVSVSGLTGEAPGLECTKLVFETDLAPVVALGYLDAASGHAKLNAETLSWEQGNLKGAVSWQLTADSMALPGGLGLLSGVEASGTIDDPAAINGTGSARIQEIDVSGVILREVEAELALKDGVARITVSKAKLFGGALEAQADIRLFEEHLPIRVQGAIHDASFDTFTREFEPPAVVLKGIASGEFSAAFDLNGIRELDGHLECAEGFSINRDVVYRLAEYTQGVAILGKSLKRAIGDTDPRPFDSAEMTVGYADGVYTITTFVSSRLLDLAPVFYIKADMARLLDLMERDGLEGLENIEYAIP